MTSGCTRHSTRSIASAASGACARIPRAASIVACVRMTGGVELRAVVQELPALAEILDGRAQVADPEVGLRQAPGSIEHRHRSGEAFTGEQRREQAVHRGFARVERLGHRAERGREAGRLRPGEPEGVRELSRVEAEQPARGGGRAEVSESRRRMPAALGQPGADHAPDPGLHLEPGDECGQRLGAGGALPFAEREHDRRDRRRAVDDRRQMRVVEVERVRLRAVGHRRHQGAGAQPAAEHGRLRLPPVTAITLLIAWASGSLDPRIAVPTQSVIDRPAASTTAGAGTRAPDRG
jgi:hypothetical protein